MKFSMTMVGTGNAWSKKNYNNSAMFHVNDKNIWLDGGSLGWLALDKLGLDIQDIDALLITHLHGDHIGHIEETAFKARYVLQKKLPFYTPKALSHIWDEALQGTLKRTAEGLVTMEDYFDVNWMPNLEVSGQPNSGDTEIFGLTFTTVPTDHIPGAYSCGFIVDNRLWFSGDATFNPRLFEIIAPNVEAIFHDAQSWTGGVHASIEELSTLPEEVRNKIYLMHIADDAQDKFGPNPHGMHWAEKGPTYVFGDGPMRILR